MTPIVLLLLEGVILVVGGGIIGALTGSWEIPIGTQAFVVACVVAIHMINTGARG
jgi:hypothetical protein